MSLLRPVTAIHNPNGSYRVGRITQPFLGNFSWERPGYVRLLNGVWRGARLWFRGASRRARVHLGIDYSGPEGTPIHAAHDGKIIAQFTDTDGARVIYQQVKVGRVYKLVAVYWHLKAGSFRFPTGMFVRRGQVIAGMGSTGKSTGSHLHFGLWKMLRGTPNRLMYATARSIDPQPFINGKPLADIV